MKPKRLIGLGLLVTFWILFFTWLHDIYGMPGQSPGHAVVHYLLLLAAVVVLIVVLALTLVLFRKRIRRLIPGARRIGRRL